MKNNLMLLGLLSGFAISSPIEAKTKRKPSSIDSPVNESCLEKSTIETVKQIANDEILSSSLERSFKNFQSRLENSYGKGRIVIEDPSDWQVFAYDSSFYQDYDKNPENEDESVYTSEDDCSYLVIVEATAGYSRGFVTVPYFARVQITRDNSSSSTDKSWKAKNGGINRVQLRVYPNKNPRG